MPLYIDLHIDNNLTPDLIKQCHVADKAIQEKYGVRYLQILLNQPQGYLFCLVEGPDKEACARVHQEAHGNIACNILEITQSDFSALLADRQKNAMDFTLNQDGSLDTGNRAILACELLGAGEGFSAANEIILQTLHQSGGRNGESFSDRQMAAFGSCTAAVDAGAAIRTSIFESKIPVEIRMGVDIGPPLKEEGDFFEDVRRSAGHFTFISGSGGITVSSEVMQLYRGETKSLKSFVRVVSVPEEKFLHSVMRCTDALWDRNDVTMSDFARELGVSKSQLVRKLKSMSGFSPNDFIRELRLRRSIRLMAERDLNVAEVTMAVGFSNPSYFTKCFRKRFGKSPSDFMATGSSAHKA